MKTEAKPNLRQDLRRLINGYQVSQALHVVAALGIADRLATSPMSAPELAADLKVSETLLYRLLRAVASIGVLEELSGQRFQLTELGEGLRSDVPGSLAGWAVFYGRPYIWAAWARLADGVRTGDNPFQLEHGTDIWSYRQAHPEEAAIFSAAMNSITGQVTAAVVSSYDFSRFGEVVDVAGGGGALIAAILGRHPHLRGVLFDLPHVVAGDRDFVEAAGVADRCRLIGGSFFEKVPDGADVYVLKSILHDWSDEDSMRILKTCRAAMRRDATLLVIERILGPRNEDRDGSFSDLLMFVGPGGRERNVEEWELLLREGGFDLHEVIPAESVAIIEARPR